MILSLLVLASFVLFLYLAVLSLTMQKPRTLSHWLLFASALCAAHWAFFSYFVYNADTLISLRFWFYISVLGMFGYFPMNLLFVISVVPDRKIRPPVALIILLPAVALFILNFYYPVVFSDFVWGEKGWIFIPSLGNFWNSLWQFYSVACFTTGIVFMAIWRSRTKLNREKKQIRLLLSTQITAIVAVYLDFRLNDLLLQIRPATISPVLLSIWIIGMVVAVKRYHFLSISPEEVSREILAAINDVIILINERQEIIYMNEKALSLFRFPYRKMDHRDIHEFLVAPNREQSLISFSKSCEVPEPDGASLLFHLLIAGPDSTAKKLSIRLTRVEDRYGDLLGYLLIGSEERPKKVMDEAWKLNDREEEICEKLAEGLSNRRIAEELGIKEQTVKNRLAIIFQKTSVSSRYELVRKLIDNK